MASANTTPDTVLTLIAAQTTTDASPLHPARVDALPANRAFQAYGSTSAGAGASVIEIYGSLWGITGTWVLLGTITLTLGTAVTNDGFASLAPWPYVAVKVVSISGTNAAVTVGVGA